jgi:hypothetical protein
MLIMATFRRQASRRLQRSALLAWRELWNELTLTVLDHADYWVERQRCCCYLVVIMDKEL